ncbi:hypothetical protein TIFTF001_046931 [Ficus carica]|uniref:Uncharacterized protein n=1 Tax=Ficus carica TaxID=3494 RepID=A0AA88CJX2_FICCA|nr:hypothetical protein TIFTF001_046931 [Ficus carica]
MSFNKQEGTCSCTQRRSNTTQDIAREVSTTTAYSIGFVVVLAQEVVLAERKLTVLRLCCRYITLLRFVGALNSDLAKPMKLSWQAKLSCVVLTCTRSGLVHDFELDWVGRPNHSMAARHVVLVERKLTTYVYAIGKLPTGNV